MKIADTDILIFTGAEGAGAGHWQRRWAERFPNARLIGPGAEPEAWRKSAIAAIQSAEKPVVVVAHGFGVSVLVQVAGDVLAGKVRGALLVAPIDHEMASPPALAKRFGEVPRDPLPFASLLVAANDDPLLSAERAADLAAAWGAELHLAGPAGRIDLSSGHGPWPEGLLMFTRLMQRI